MAEESTILLSKDTIELLKKAKENSRETYNELLRKVVTLYLEAKKEQEIKKKTKDVQTKEIRLGPFIGDHDFQVRVRQAEGFLKEGHRVKLVVKFQGRQLSKKEFGYNLAKKFSESISLSGKQDVLPKWEGRLLVSFFAPAKKINAKDEN